MFFKWVLPHPILRVRFFFASGSFLHPPTFMNPFCRRMARSSAERIVILSHWKEPGTSGTETRQSCRTSFHHGGFHLPFPHFRLFRHTHPHRAVLSPLSPWYILAYHHTPVDATLPPPFFTHCRPLQPRPFFLSTDSRTLLHAAPPIADADLSPWPGRTHKRWMRHARFNNRSGRPSARTSVNRSTFSDEFPPKSHHISLVQR